MDDNTEDKQADSLSQEMGSSKFSIESPEGEVQGEEGTAPMLEEPGVDTRWPNDERTVEAAGMENRYLDQLAERDARIEGLAMQLHVDPATGFGNKDALYAALPEAEKGENRRDVIAFDLNNFGKINKLLEHGQVAGDAHLRSAANAIRLATMYFGSSSIDPHPERRSADKDQQPKRRKGDMDNDPRRGQLFRRGGDEFVVLAPVGELERDETFEPNSADELVIPASTRTAEAIILLARHLYGTRPFKGTGPDGEPMQTMVSLSGAWGETFEQADAALQPRKHSDKFQQLADDDLPNAA
jgi:hypothetical protein